MSRPCLLVQSYSSLTLKHLSEVLSIRASGADLTLGPSQACSQVSGLSPHKPSSCSQPPSHPHPPNLLEISFSLKQSLALFPKPGRIKMLSKKTETRELHSVLMFLHQDNFVCSSRLVYLFFSKDCYARSRNNEFVSPLVITKQNLIYINFSQFW